MAEATVSQHVLGVARNDPGEEQNDGIVRDGDFQGGDPTPGGESSKDGANIEKGETVQKIEKVEKKEKKPSKLKETWKKLGLDIPTVMMMFKSVFFSPLWMRWNLLI